ncbi:MAG: ATP synthase F1 subunit epsilon [Candidatus Binatia bacterium]
MAETLTLRILTPEREVLDTTVDSVTAEGALGQFGVLPKHISFLTALEPGILAYGRPGDRAAMIAIKSGYAEVRDDEVTILADEAVRVGDIDPGAARAKLEKARQALEAVPFGEPGHEQALREVRWGEVLVSA